MISLDEAERRLDRLARAWPLVQGVTPLNLRSEVERLLDARRRGLARSPRFVYADARPHPDLPARLDALADRLSPRDARLSRFASSLAVELRILLALDGPEMRRLAGRRFCCSPGDDRRALAWASTPPEPAEQELVRSDDARDPRSLLSALRRRLGELPVRVVLRDDIASLAATGDGVVFVARGRMVTLRAAERVAVHEVEGHVLPWADRRARGRGRGPAELDEEEGRALQIEEREGFLDGARKKELGLRHVAACMAHQGDPFARITDCLEDLGASVEAAAWIAARALRGGGLGRERVYLPSLWALPA